MQYYPGGNLGELIERTLLSEKVVKIYAA